MRHFDRVIAKAYIPALTLLAAGLVVMLAFWGFVDGTLPTAVRAIARWLPLILLLAGFGWGLVTTVRMWRRPRVEPEADVLVEAPRAE